MSPGKKKVAGQSHASHERWMVSYADFVTLLFAVFVVLFASAQQSKDAPQLISEAVNHALRNGSLSEAIRLLRSERQRLATSGRPAARPDLQSSLVLLTKRLESEMLAGKVDVRLDSRGLVVSLWQAAFFPSGQATIDPATYPIVDKLAVVMADLQNPIRLEGHTDPVPISNSRFKSNWELSAARSIAMLELLARRNRIEPHRLSISGFAENAPVDTNADEAGRAKNRRVDVVILNTPGPEGSGK